MHPLASDHIKNLEATLGKSSDSQKQLHVASMEMDAVRRELDQLRQENHHLYQEMQQYREQARPSTATAMHPHPGHYAPSAGNAMMVDTSRSLPPLANGIPAANSMQGVQYTEERR